jgi:hypothetical protein
MTTGPDVLTEAAERGQQPLRPPGRREALQHPPDPDRLMGVLGPAVEVLRAAVPHRRQQLAVSEPLRQYIRPYRRPLAVLVVLQAISTLARYTFRRSTPRSSTAASSRVTRKPSRDSVV